MFIDGQIFSLQRQGGISRLYYEVLKLLNQGDDCVLYRGLAQDGYDWSEVSVTKNIGATWQPSSRLMGKLGRVFDNLWLDSEWAKYKKTNDATYIATYYRLPKRSSDCRIIVGDYDCAHERFPELFPGSDKLKEMKHRAFLRADLIATISESSKQDVIKFYDIPDHKIEVFHLGVDPFFDRSHMDNSFRKHEGKPYLLYVGSRAPYKNFSILQEAFRLGLHKDYDLAVVGGGELSATEKASLEGVGYWYPANDGELRALYQGAAAFIYPSLYEGFGLPPLEALACGAPVVVADHPVSHEVLAEHVEYFNCDDALGLIDAVDRAVHHNKDVRELGYKHARSYTWAASAKRFYSLVGSCEDST